MCAVGAILSLRASKRSLIQVVVLIGSTSALQVEAYASKLCSRTVDQERICEKNRQYAGFFMPAVLKLEQTECD